MQEVIVPRIRAIKAIYYLAAIAFHWMLFFTSVGNYFHGGTLLEWVALEVLAVVIAAMAIWLVSKMRGIERGAVVLCCVIPVISVVWSLIATINR